MGLSIFRVRDFRNSVDEGLELSDKSRTEEWRIESEDEWFRRVRNMCTSGYEHAQSLIALTREEDRKKFKQFCKEYGVPLKNT